MTCADCVFFAQKNKRVAKYGACVLPHLPRDVAQIKDILFFVNKKTKPCEFFQRRQNEKEACLNENAQEKK